MKIKGLSGTAQLTNDSVVLTHHGFAAGKAKKEASPHTVLLSSIVAVDISPGKIATPGVIHFRTGRYETDPKTDPASLQFGARTDAKVFADAVRDAAQIHDAEPPLPMPTIATDAPITPHVTQPTSTDKPLKPSLMERMAQSADTHKHDAAFEGLRVSGPKLSKGLKSWPVSECVATVDHGAAIAARITGTRIATGAVLLGPIGAILGGLAKKNRAKVFLSIEVPDDLILVELKPKHEGDARKFAAKLNQAAAHHAT